MMPQLYDHVKWYHRLAVLPIRFLSLFGIGPFGGGYSVSAVIEALIAYHRKTPLDFELTKTEDFVLKQIRDLPGAEFLVEYRDLNYVAQREILKRWGSTPLGVIWIGGGIFTLDHPLLAERKNSDWHFWTDAHPRIVKSAQAVFHEYQLQEQGYDLSSHEVILPRDIDQMNRMIAFAQNHGCKHLVIQGYGLSYALTYAENLQWLTGLATSSELSMSFVFNSLETVELPGKFVAALDNQKMVRYREAEIQSLFAQVFPLAEIVWSTTPDKTKSQNTFTWLIEVPAQKG